MGTLPAVAAMLFVYGVRAAPGKAPAASGSTPGVLSYQGQLTDAAGNPVNGNVDITFRLYDVPEGGTPLWEEAHTGANAVPVEGGLFHVLLGSLNPIPSDVWSHDDALYLGIQVESDPEMTPREGGGGGAVGVDGAGWHGERRDARQYRIW